jgi:integrase
VAGASVECKATSPSGHIEQLPSGSFRVIVYAGTDPLTARPLRHRETARTIPQAQIVLGRLLERVGAGRRPDSRVLVRELMARYLEVAELEASTRDTYDGYIRRTILPALGPVEVRKVRGPTLDTFYARLRRCSEVSCVSGRPFIVHNRFPVLSDAGGRFQRWQRIALALR